MSLFCLSRIPLILFKVTLTKPTTKPKKKGEHGSVKREKEELCSKTVAIVIFGSQVF